MSASSVRRTLWISFTATAVVVWAVLLLSAMKLDSAIEPSVNAPIFAEAASAASAPEVGKAR